MNSSICILMKPHRWKREQDSWKRPVKYSGRNGILVATQNDQDVNGLNIYFCISYNMVSKKLCKYIWFGLQSFWEEDNIPGSPHVHNFSTSSFFFFFIIFFLMLTALVLLNHLFGILLLQTHFWKFEKLIFNWNLFS